MANFSHKWLKARAGMIDETVSAPDAGQFDSNLEASFYSQLANAGAALPETQYPFHSQRRWRFDFAWPGVGVAVEINGGLSVGKPCPSCGRRAAGRHTNRSTYGADLEKINTAQVSGWKVLQFTADQVESGAAAAFTVSALKEAGNG